MSIYKKMFQVQQLELTFNKDGNNPFFKSNYITLDNIVSILTPTLNDLGLLVIHRQDGGFVNTEVIDIETGDKVISQFKMPDVQDPQKMGAIISYGKRYNLGQLFNIITDRDDDGEGYHGRDKKTSEDKKTTTSKSQFNDDNLEKFKLRLMNNQINADTYEEAIKLISSKYEINDDMDKKLKALYFKK